MISKQLSPTNYLSRNTAFQQLRGFNEEQTALAVGCTMINAGRQSESTRSNIVEGHSDTVSLGTGLGASDMENLLDPEEPMDKMGP